MPSATPNRSAPRARSTDPAQLSLFAPLDTPLSDAEREHIVRERTIVLWEEARASWRIDRRFTLDVSFDLKGRTVGKAIRNGDALRIRYNREALAQNFADMRDETVPHEVAHLVCFARPRLGRGHDAGWRAVCVALGGKGGRCYANDAYALTKVRRTWRYTYRLDSGEEIALSHRHHLAVRRGVHLFVRRTRETIEARHWTGDRELS